jgi:hypothetical protein
LLFGLSISIFATSGFILYFLSSMSTFVSTEGELTGPVAVAKVVQRNGHALIYHHLLLLLLQPCIGS